MDRMVLLICLVAGLGAGSLAFVQAGRRPALAVRLRGLGAACWLLALAMGLLSCL
jgi:hypothetical protein